MTKKKQKDLVTETFVHCDEYIEDTSKPEVLRKFLERARMPAHGHLVESPFPKLFATYNGKSWQGVDPGDRVRVVMASRMGDVGCTKILTAETGYQVRCAVADLSDFSDTPERF